MARLQLALLALACVLVPAVAATTTARPGDALFAALQRAAAGMKLNATHPRFPSRAGFALVRHSAFSAQQCRFAAHTHARRAAALRQPTSCTSKHEAALCGDCVECVTRACLPRELACIVVQQAPSATMLTLSTRTAAQLHGDQRALAAAQEHALHHAHVLLSHLHQAASRAV